MSKKNMYVLMIPIIGVLVLAMSFAQAGATDFNYEIPRWKMVVDTMEYGSQSPICLAVSEDEKGSVFELGDNMKTRQVARFYCKTDRGAGETKYFSKLLDERTFSPQVETGRYKLTFPIFVAGKSGLSVKKVTVTSDDVNVSKENGFYTYTVGDLQFDIWLSNNKKFKGKYRWVANDSAYGSFALVLFPEGYVPASGPAGTDKVSLQEVMQEVQKYGFEIDRVVHIDEHQRISEIPLVMDKKNGVISVPRELTERNNGYQIYFSDAGTIRCNKAKIQNNKLAVVSGECISKETEVAHMTSRAAADDGQEPGIQGGQSGGTGASQAGTPAGGGNGDVQTPASPTSPEPVAPQERTVAVALKDAQGNPIADGDVKVSYLISSIRKFHKEILKTGPEGRAKISFPLDAYSIKFAPAVEGYGYKDEDGNPSRYFSDVSLLPGDNVVDLGLMRTIQKDVKISLAIQGVAESIPLRKIKNLMIEYSISGGRRRIVGADATAHVTGVEGERVSFTVAAPGFVYTDPELGHAIGELEDEVHLELVPDYAVADVRLDLTHKEGEVKTYADALAFVAFTALNAKGEMVVNKQRIRYDRDRGAYFLPQLQYIRGTPLKFSVEQGTNHSEIGGDFQWDGSAWTARARLKLNRPMMVVVINPSDTLIRKDMSVYENQALFNDQVMFMLRKLAREPFTEMASRVAYYSALSGNEVKIVFPKSDDQWGGMPPQTFQSELFAISPDNRYARSVDIFNAVMRDVDRYEYDDSSYKAVILIVSGLPDSAKYRSNFGASLESDLKELMPQLRANRVKMMQVAFSLLPKEPFSKVGTNAIMANYDILESLVAHTRFGNELGLEIPERFQKFYSAD